MAPFPKRTRSQAFTAPKDRTTKTIMERNRLSRPLLSLPGELRNEIWGYVLGFQLIHVMEERPHNGVHGPDLRFFHTVCESPITEQQAWKFSRMELYEEVVKQTSTELATVDLRHCHHRHAICYDALRNGPTKRLHIDLLSVCRQTYIESVRFLWGSNTWSIDDSQTFNQWFRRRNALQRLLMKKVHLGSDIANDTVPRSVLFKYNMLEELYVDITTNSTYENCCFPFFRFKKIFAI
ncbi:hypothetical protein BKA64DRAFT_747084, partial [Cadophora sp. MPI-SDFR-AT-0126]